MRGYSAKEWAVENGKLVADILTAIRFFIGLLIVVCAFLAEPSLLPLVVALTLMGWTTDVLDGKMARMDRAGKRSWIGDLDFATDLILIYSGLLYFITAGYLPLRPFLFYGAYAAVTGLVWTKKSVMMAVAAPIAAVPIIMSFVHYPVWGWVFVGWIAVDLILNWSDFTSEIREFIDDVDER